MARSFGIVDTKLEEAEYFLKKFQQCGWNLREAQFLFNAFVSSTRSVTFALQASLKGTKNSNEWYLDWQKRLKGSALARFFHNCRTDIQHVGTNFVNGVTTSPDGPILLLSDGSFENDKNVPIKNAFIATDLYFRIVCHVVRDAYDRFGHVIDPEVFFSVEGLGLNNLTIEDLEQEAGLPRGWTRLDGEHGFTDEDRIRLVRRSAAITNCRGVLAEYPPPPDHIWH